MEHCPHHTWTFAIFTRATFRWRLYLLMGLEPVFTEEDGGHHGEAGGQEGEAGEHCGHCGEDGDGHNLPEAAAALAVKMCALLWKLFLEKDFLRPSDTPGVQTEPARDLSIASGESVSNPVILNINKMSSSVITT